MIIACPGCQRRFDVSGRPPGMDARCRCGRRFQIPKVAPDAHTRSCQSCGGAVSTTATHCPYCSSPVAMQRCPRCLGIVAAGGRFCQHCGEDVAASARKLEVGEKRDVACPRCGAERLEALLLDGLALDRCLACGGLWLDHRVFAHLQRAEASKSPIMARLEELPNPPPTPHKRQYIPCPECKKLMNPRNFARYSGVIVDECREHGVWFDVGELAAIMRFIRDGGMDKARARMDRDLQEKKGLKNFSTGLAQARMPRSGEVNGPGRDGSTTVLEDFLHTVASLFG